MQKGSQNRHNCFQFISRDNIIRSFRKRHQLKFFCQSYKKVLTIFFLNSPEKVMTKINFPTFIFFLKLLANFYVGWCATCYDCKFQKKVINFYKIKRRAKCFGSIETLKKSSWPFLKPNLHFRKQNTQKNKNCPKILNT